MTQYLTFNSAQAAREYRHLHGTGGWIFVPEKGGEVVLFPPHMTPTNIFKHAMVRGQSGDLIGHG